MAKDNNNFCPTPYEDKLLAELVNPENFGKPVAEVCRKAEVSRDVYYDMRKKDGFWEFFINLKMDMIKQRAGDLYDATFKYATSNAKNHADRKLLFEMLKLYKNEQNINVKKTDDIEDLSEEELQIELENLRKGSC